MLAPRFKTQSGELNIYSEPMKPKDNYKLKQKESRIGDQERLTRHSESPEGYEPNRALSLDPRKGYMVAELVAESGERPNKAQLALETCSRALDLTRSTGALVMPPNTSTRGITTHKNIKQENQVKNGVWDPKGCQHHG